MSRLYEKQSDEFVALVRKAGGVATSARAATGTIYVTVDQFKARFSDHNDAYGSADISIDPQGCTLLQALRACARETGLDLSRAIRAREAAEKAAATRRAKQIAAAGDQPAIYTAPVDPDRQRAALLARWPNYDAMSYKQRGRCRNIINRQLLAKENT